MISRLDCYLPERAEEDWARLRHLGQHRFRLVGEVVGYRNQSRKLLSCRWPAALACAAKPLESTTWLACLAVTVNRGHGDPAMLHGLGREGFITAVRDELPRFGAQRVCHKVANRFFDALADGHGVIFLPELDHPDVPLGAVVGVHRRMHAVRMMRCIRLGCG